MGTIGNLRRALGSAPAQFSDLVEVVPAMNPVKLPPLPGAQGTQNGMIQDWRVGTVLRLSLPDDCVHLGNFREDVSQNQFRRNPARVAEPGERAAVSPQLIPARSAFCMKGNRAGNP